MEQSTEKYNQDTSNDITSWFPSELMMIIFEKLDVKSLYICMFVCRKWNSIAHRIADHKKLWRVIVKDHVINGGNYFKIKSINLNWREMFEKSLLWSHCDKAEVTLHETYVIDDIKKINVYRDHLIVISCMFVKYFDIETSQMKKKLENTCVDFNESDFIILKAVLNGESDKLLHLYGKQSATDFNITRSNEITIDRVIHYKLEDYRCYVTDSRNILTVYIWRNGDWELKFMARYYGDSEITAALNIFNDEAYILLNSGSIMWANVPKMAFEKKVNITIPRADNEMKVYAKMFHRFGVVFGVNANKEFSFNEHSSNVDSYVMECPNLSCVTQHGEILFIGYADGKINLFLPRNQNKSNILKRTILATDWTKTNEARIVSIDVHEGREHHDVFIATHSEIFHLVLKHPNKDNYLYSEILPAIPEITIPEESYSV